MMFGWMMFSKIIGSISCSWFQINAELLVLGFAVFEPVTAHIHGFGSAWFDFIVLEDTRRCFDVRLGVRYCGNPSSSNVTADEV